MGTSGAGKNVLCLGQVEHLQTRVNLMTESRLARKINKCIFLSKFNALFSGLE